MKKILLTLAVVAVCSSLASANADMFTGRFKPDKKYCNNEMREADRVYAKIGPEYGGASLMILQFQSYGDDATLEDVLLGQGSRQAPGTTVSIHGIVTEQWETVILGNVLRSVVTVTRPSMNYVRRTEITVTDYGSFLEINMMPDNEFCRLIRY